MRERHTGLGRFTASGTRKTEGRSPHPWMVRKDRTIRDSPVCQIMCDQTCPGCNSNVDKPIDRKCSACIARAEDLLSLSSDSGPREAVEET